MIITFFGHRALIDSASLEKNLQKVIQENIKKSEKIRFYCGGYGEFDSLCARVSNFIKKEQECEVVLITPYITKEHQNKLKIILDSGLYDSIMYPPLEGVPLKYAISKRNLWMVDKADLIIAYVKYTFGGAYKSLEYAHKKNKKIINLADLF